ncbi:MAG: hypothetical protein N3E47_08380 [Candidatus Bathyarchaeota archaeon]|nr:hypothetical protein [Candidatus Bathyarchaeota archaeon]
MEHTKPAKSPAKVPTNVPRGKHITIFMGVMVDVASIIVGVDLSPEKRLLMPGSG